MLRYNQSTGEFHRDGILLGKGYSGRAEGRDNPDMQATRSIGPIPCGKYRIGPVWDTPNLGPVSIPLAPVDHNALGRSGFYIHGDNKSHDASHGCIILPRNVRAQIVGLALLGEDLEVVSGKS